MIRRKPLLLLVAALALGAFAQAPAAKPQPQGSQAAQPQGGSHDAHAGAPAQAKPAETVAPATPADTRRADELQKRRTEAGNSIAAEEARTANEAAGTEEGDDENAPFRKSPSVRALSRVTGIPLASAYWVFVALNFAILALILYLISKSRIPAMFRSRTEVIRKSLDEAQRSSADANRRLTDIETRLSRLDAEVAEMHAQADREAQAEEERIRAAAEEDQRRIVQAAQAEIEALSKNARRELKVYAADLAVALAEQRIQVDAATDQQLVRSFTDQLGADGRGRS
jgi:F-type H+-transporting ATPase subunit b